MEGLVLEAIKHIGGGTTAPKAVLCLTPPSLPSTSA
jgi:hypothetical protein